ncbi:Peroxisomal membrane (Mpv17/PMP22) family protein [Quillaja saponaria]|uniref:Peroxisomal membrane (Mpv17/PMP22) family protein n=1 Tax=Quillaja saponaria TaxID=32244 RepID=A0AAD7KZ65_QUISA|nr:Peroxisomal membrane (Mpv17/PMP22) family protein [Quillaja saponaria]
MASVHSIASQSFLSRSKPKLNKPMIPHTLSISTPSFQRPKLSQNPIFPRTKQKNNWVVVNSMVEDCDVLPLQSGDGTENQAGGIVSRVEMESGEGELVSQVGGFGTSEGQYSFEGANEFQGFSSSSASVVDERRRENEEMERLIDRAINGTIVLAAGTFAITKLLTIDRDYWHGWTIYEILRYAPQHNWFAYEEALKTNPVLAKMVISGVVYSLGDWIAQCFEGKPLFEFDRTRMLRSGLVGFTLHGSLSHYYYQFCEELFPFEDWWVVPAKVVFDQTVWAAIWNSIYFTVLGFLRLESPLNVFSELEATFWPMLTAGWKLWPFAHVITYGVIPVEQRLLWVDCVELIWVTILSTYSNEKSEARISELPAEENSSTPSIGPPEKLENTGVE